MALDTINGDRVYLGSVTFAGAMNLPANTVQDVGVAAGANVSASKLEHQHEPTYAQAGATTGFVERKVVHVVKGATGSVFDFRVGAVTAGTGTATATIDLQKNGVSILTAPISLDSTMAAYALKTPAGYTSTALVAGDVLEVVVSAVSAGTGAIAKGLFANLAVREKAQ